MSFKMSFTLIVPIAADNKEYERKMPFVFNLDDEGILLCIKAIMGLNLKLFDSIYFTILKTHAERFYLKEIFNLQFKRLGLNKAKVVELNEPTKSQPETIYQTIRNENITGSILVKDADCSFSCEILPQNGLTIYPLEKLKWVNPQNKSYVAVDDMFYVTNIIERRIISHYFSAGGYCFEKADDFCRYYLQYQDRPGLYLSHIIYAMLLDKVTFRPIHIENYVDFECLKTGNYVSQ